MGRALVLETFRADKGRSRGHCYTILDEPAGEVLFLGRVLDPSAR